MQEAVPPDAKLQVIDDEENILPKTKRSWFGTISSISETALHDFVDIMVFLIVGALLAAFVRLLISQDDIARVSAGQPQLAILVMMGLAIVLCLPAVSTPEGNADALTRILTVISLTYPAYYLLVSWGISLRIVIRAYRQRAGHVKTSGPPAKEPDRAET